MRKSLLLFAAAAASCLPAAAQLTTITATKLQMAGSKIATGSVFFTPVNRIGSPIPFAGGDGSINGPMAFGCTIVNGAITGMIQEDGSTSGTCQVPDSALTTPVSLLYEIKILDTSSNKLTGGKGWTMQAVVGVTGTTWALDHYGPAADTSSIQPINLPLPAATVPTSCSAPSFFTRSTDHSLWSCVNGVYVAVSGVTSGGTVYTVFSASTDGLVPHPVTSTGKFLRDDGSWANASTLASSATCSSTYALSWSTAGDRAVDLTLTGNCAITIPAAPSDGIYRRLTLIIRPAGFQATMPASSSALVWSGGSAPVPSTSAITVITFGSTGVAPVLGGL